jgi:ferric-dicitrate binding protein FerR (iron transport regulator)
MTKLNKDILKRYTSDDYTVKDERYVTNQFTNEENLEELREELKADWDVNNYTNHNKDLSKVFETIQNEIQPAKSNKLIRLYKVYSSIAAILLLPLISLFVFNNLKNDYQNSNQTLSMIQAAPGTKVQFLLPDGTSGWLTGGSELSYQTSFKNRHVNLKGEAYFDVTHDKDHPFEVLGSGSKIVVLGTRFSANMWPQNPTTEVVLESGKVKFVPANKSEATILEPGEMLIYQKSSDKCVVNEVNAKLINAEVKGKLIFRGESIDEVAKKLEAWFNVEVILEGKHSNAYKCRATFKDESLEEVLKLIKLTIPMSYQIEQPVLLANGKYSKRKVILKANQK